MDADLSVRDEAQMIAAILAGDSDHYHELIRPYERGVYKMAFSFMRNESDAEDVAQEAFLKAFRKLGDFRGQARFSTWLISITLNEARGRLRRRPNVQMESLDKFYDEGCRISPLPIRDWRETPSEALERREICQMLRDAIANLSPLYRGVLLLRDVSGFSIEETATALVITSGTVKVRLHRARMMMQRELAPKLKTAASPPQQSSTSVRRCGIGSGPPSVGQTMGALRRVNEPTILAKP